MSVRLAHTAANKYVVTHLAHTIASVLMGIDSTMTTTLVPVSC